LLRFILQQNLRPLQATKQDTNPYFKTIDPITATRFAANSV